MHSRTGRRLGAYLIDIGLLFAVLAPLGQLVLRLFGRRTPQTGPEIWLTIPWNFSLPCWIYFILSARSRGGATVGKRLLGLRVASAGGPVSTPRAILRTAVLLLPWELIHLSTFGLSEAPGTFTAKQKLGLGLANALTLLYLIVTVATRGRRSVHDCVAGTEVDFAAPVATSIVPPAPVARQSDQPPSPGRQHGK